MILLIKSRNWQVEFGRSGLLKILENFLLVIKIFVYHQWCKLPNHLDHSTDSNLILTGKTCSTKTLNWHMHLSIYCLQTDRALVKLLHAVILAMRSFAFSLSSYTLVFISLYIERMISAYTINILSSEVFPLVLWIIN